MGHFSFFFPPTDHVARPTQTVSDDSLPRSSSDLLQKKCAALGIKAIPDPKNPCLHRSTVTLPARLKLAPVKVLALGIVVRWPECAPVLDSVNPDGLQCMIGVGGGVVILRSSGKNLSPIF